MVIGGGVDGNDHGGIDEVNGDDNVCDTGCDNGKEQLGGPLAGTDQTDWAA